MQKVDPISGLAKVAAFRRFLVRMRKRQRVTPILFQLCLGRLSRETGFCRETLLSMLPAEYYVSPPSVNYGDLPPQHYANCSYWMDRIAASLLIDPSGVNRADVASLDADRLSGHICGDILLATQIYGEEALGSILTADCRKEVWRLYRLYQSGEVMTWHVAWYASELAKLLQVEAAYFATVR